MTARGPARPPEPTHYRFIYLLVAQFGLILIYPFVAGERSREGVGAAFVLVMLVAALWAVARDRRIVTIALVFAVPAIIGNVVTALTPGNPLFVPTVVFGLLFVVFVTSVIFRGVVMSPVVTTETLYGAITAYLFLGISWTWAYVLVELLHPGSFRSADGVVKPPDLTFLSFITLTSVGYGDILPVSPYARSLAILEAIAGQMYLAVFIARLVGLHGQSVEPPAD